MLEDQERWNIRHVEKPMPQHVTKTVEKYIKKATVGDALDIACGTGRNTHFLAEQGFRVDAVDFSDYALGCIKDDVNITKHEVDLDLYNIEKRYDLIININYLNRRLLPQIKEALKEGGLIIFETFIIAHNTPEQGSMNPNYLLETNELLKSFIDLDIIYYEEKDIVNLRGEDARLASLVAKKS